MRGRIIICVLAIVALGFSAGANAEINRADEEAVAAGMELALLDLLGVQDVETKFRDQGNGIYSLSVSLDQLDLDRDFIASLSSAKDVTNLAHGHQISSPSDVSVLIHAALSSLGLTYNFWWTAANVGETADHKTTVSHKGPGADLKLVETLTYDGSAIVLFFTEATHENSGVFKSSVKIKGASNAKTKAGCFSQ